MSNELLSIQSHLTSYYSAGIQNPIWSNLNIINFQLNYLISDNGMVNFEGLYYKERN